MAALIKSAIIIASEKHETGPPFRWTIGTASAWLTLVILSVLFVLPFGWMLSTSLKASNELFGPNWLPARLMWENFQRAFSYGDWGRWTLNTVTITTVAVFGTLLSTSLVAYSFARLRWPGRDTLFFVVLATMMLPSVVTMIPQFILYSKLPAFGFQGSPNWINTFLPLTVPAFTGNAFYIFLLRQCMRSIPAELSDAARIDGASDLRIWWAIVLPLSKPALATITIFAFQGAWEDFMGPLLYLQREDLYTLQLGLRQFEFAAGGVPAWNWLMAASLVVMLPVLVIYGVFQRYFIEGVTVTGLGRR